VFVRQSVCQQCISSSPKGRIFVKFYIGDFALKFIEKNFTYVINALSTDHSNWRFVYNLKTYQALYVNTSVRFIVADDIKSS
jgi:hypothetical protein